MWRDPIPDPICVRCFKRSTFTIKGSSYCSRRCEVLYDREKRAQRIQKVRLALAEGVHAKETRKPPQDDSATSEEKPE